MSDHFEHEDETTLDRLLNAEGKNWRCEMDEQLPAAPDFVARMRKQLTGDSVELFAPDRDDIGEANAPFAALAMAIADKGKNTQKGTQIMSVDSSTDTATLPLSTPVTPHPPRRRFAGLAAGTVALVIVGLIAATLALTLQHRHTLPGSGSLHTPTVTSKTPITAPKKTPVTSPAGSGPYDYRPLVIAPSNPQIVYNVAGNGTQLVRSSDGGATFHPIATPPTSLNGAFFTIMISPLDANHLVVAAYTSACVAQGDVQHRARLSALAGSTSCTQDFFSADGGQTWSALNLPFAGVIGYINGLLRPMSESYGEQAVFFAQGSRLYAAAAASNALPDGFVLSGPGIRIVVSSDDGASWQFADNGLGNSISDFAAAPQGDVVYATTSSYSNSLTISAITLWRSDNAGANWAQVSTPPDYPDLGMIVSSSGALYLNTSQIATAGEKSSPTPGVVVSQDGGKTFVHAPATGLPPTQTITGPIGVLGDGSVVVEGAGGMYTDPSALYAWRPGQPSWRQIGPRFTSAIIWAVIVPHGGADIVYEIHLNESITHFTV